MKKIWRDIAATQEVIEKYNIIGYKEGTHISLFIENHPEENLRVYLINTTAVHLLDLSTFQEVFALNSLKELSLEAVNITEPSSQEIFERQISGKGEYITLFTQLTKKFGGVSKVMLLVLLPFSVRPHHARTSIGGATIDFLKKNQWLLPLKKIARGACGLKLAMEQHYI